MILNNFIIVIEIGFFFVYSWIHSNIDLNTILIIHQMWKRKSLHKKRMKKWQSKIWKQNLWTFSMLLKRKMTWNKIRFENNIIFAFHIISKGKYLFVSFFIILNQFLRHLVYWTSKFCLHFSFDLKVMK